MSALGHYLEEEGIATVAISLIRPQTEHTRPPRALWVPFELGRPFGPPGDRAFQLRVVRAALGLLARAEGPVVIEDFRDDDPRTAPDPAWLPPALPVGDGSLAARLMAEIAALRGAHDRWVAERGRTTVGLSGLPIADCGRIVAGWLGGDMPPSPREGISAVLMLRFAADDLKAYCLEAAASGPARPSSRQLGDWLWNQTAAGAAMRALRTLGLASDDTRIQAVLGNFMVPAVRVAAQG